MVIESCAKCSECIYQGKPCINLLWQSLDTTRAKLAKKIENTKVELARVLSRLFCQKKILYQANDRAKYKTKILFDKIEAAGNLENGQEVDCPAAATGISLSPMVWINIDIVEDAIQLDENPEAFCSSSLNS